MKRFKTLSLILLSLTSFGFANKNTSAQPTQANLISDFESEAEVNASIVYAAWGAKKNFSKEKKSHGEGSMYLEFEAGTPLPMPNQYPDFYYENQLRFFPLTDTLISHSPDYSLTESFLLDVYGTCGRAFNVYFNIMTTSGKKIELGPQIALDNQWSTLSFTLDPVKANYLGISSISYFYLSFDLVYEGATPVSMYLDSFRTHDYQSKPSVALPPLPALAKGTVANFEDDYLFDTLWINNPGLPIHSRYFQLEKNQNPKYVKEGKQSLAITMYPSIQQETSMRRYFEIRFPEEYIKAIDFASFEAEKDQYRFVYDVYLDYDYPVFCNLNITDTVGDHLEITHNLTPNDWTEISQPLNSPYIWGGKAGNKSLDWANVNNLYFIMREYYGAKRAYVYIDNIRIEKIQTEEAK